MGIIGDSTNVPGAGGIFGYNAINCSAINCYSIGLIEKACGGIFGSYCDNAIASDCYSIGNIIENGGGIIGASAINSTSSNCYSNGNIGINAGGIFGIGSNGCIANNCYSSGNIDSVNNAGGIYGLSYGTSNAIHCYTSGNSGIAIGGIYSTSNTDGIFNYSNVNNGGSGWSDVQAIITLQNYMTVWISFIINTPFLLLSFNNNFYNGDTNAVINYGGSQTTTLTTSGTSTSYILPDTIVAGITINTTTGQITYSGIDQTITYTFYIMNYESANGLFWAYDIIQFTLDIVSSPCYLEGTKILCRINNGLSYISIEDITIGTIIKTYKRGYKRVIHIGKCQIKKEPIVGTSNLNKLYILEKDKFPKLFQNLYITGAHSILVNNLPSKVKSLLTFANRVPNIEDKFLLPAFANNKCRLVAPEELIYSTNTSKSSTYHTVYHLVLENNNKYKNYGIWANGILSETLSIHNYLKCFYKNNAKN